MFRLSYGPADATATHSCFSKIQIGFTFLVLAHLDSPRKRAVKCVCVCACVCARARVQLMVSYITAELLFYCGTGTVLCYIFLLAR